MIDSSDLNTAQGYSVVFSDLAFVCGYVLDI